MAMLYTEDQQMLRDSAREFLDRRAPVSHLRSLRDANDALGFDPELWREMADLGWAGTAIDEAHGGIGFGQVGLNVLFQEIGRSLSPCPLLSSATLSASALALGGSEEQRAAWLPTIADGSKRLALAHDEAAIHRPERVEARAESTGSGWRLSGRKHSVIDGHAVDALLVSARAEGDLAVFLVPADSKGLDVENHLLLDARRIGTVTLNGVELDDAARLPAAADDWLDTVLDRGRIAQSGELLGIAETVFAMTLDYLRQRKQFGVTIGSFQALQHRAAHLYGEIEMLKSVVLKAAQVADGGDAHALALHASLTKAKASAVAELACNEAVQLHGGIGMTDDYDLGFYLKRCRALQQLLGDEYHHLERFARLRHY